MGKNSNLINTAGKPSAPARSEWDREAVGWHGRGGAHCAAQPLTVTTPRNASWHSGGGRFDG